MIVDSGVSIYGEAKSGDSQGRYYYQGVVDCAGYDCGGMSKDIMSDYIVTFLNGNSVSVGSAKFQNATARFCNCQSVSTGKARNTPHYFFYDCTLSSLSFTKHSDGGTADAKFLGGKYAYGFGGITDAASRIYAGAFSPKPDKDTWVIESLRSTMTFSQHADSYWYLEPNQDPNVAKIGGTKYLTIEEALAYLDDNDSATMTLLRDVNMAAPYTLVAGKSLIIELGGCHIDAPNGFIKNYGSLSIRNNNNSLAVSGVTVGNGKNVVENYDNGTVDICYGLYEGNFVVNGGAFTTHHGKFVGSFVKNGGEMNLKGGIFSSDVSALLNDGYHAFSYDGWYYVGRFPKPEEGSSNVASFARVLTAMPSSDKTLYLAKKLYALESCSNVDEWKYVAELKAAYAFFADSSFYFDILVGFDRDVAANTVQGTVNTKLGPKSENLSQMSAGALTRIFSPRITQGPISYERFIYDNGEGNYDTMEAGISDVNNANNGTACVLAMDLWKFHDKTKTTKDSYLTILALPYVFGAGNNVAMIRPATGAATFYATLDAAMGAVANGGTVMLANDNTAPLKLEKAGTYTFDTMGFKHSGGVELGEGLSIKSETPVASSVETLIPGAIATTYVVVEGSAATKVDTPTAVSGLVYDGTEKTGVAAGTGYTLSGNTATTAGSYTATATLEEGYVWSDDSSEAKEISWSIGKVSLTATAENKSVIRGETVPYTITYSGFVNGEDVSALTAAPTASCDYNAADMSATATSYPITLSGGSASNYDITLVSGTLTVNQCVAIIEQGGETGHYTSLSAAVEATSGNTITVTVTANDTETVTLPQGKTLVVTVNDGVEATVTVNPAEGEFVEAETSGATTTYVSKKITVEMEDPPAQATVEVVKVDHGVTNAVSDASLVNEAVQVLTGNHDVSRTDNTDKLGVLDVITVTPTKIVEDVTSGTMIIRSATFEVVPHLKAGQSLAEGQKFKFRLPVDAAATQLAAIVYHGAAQFGIYPVQTYNDEKYVEVESDTFSPYGYELLDGETANPIAAIGTTGYATLPDAIAAASNGDTITVFAGTFDIGSDTIVVNKQVTITGAGKDTTTLNSTATGKAAFSIQASNVTIENMTINQADKTASNTTHIQIGSKSAVVENVTVQDVKFTGSKYSLSVYAKNLTVDSCDFVEPGSDAILLYTVQGTSVISDNTFVQTSPNGQGFIYGTTSDGTDPLSSGSLTISGNTATGGRCLYHCNNQDRFDTSTKMTLDIVGNLATNYSNKGIVFAGHSSTSLGSIFNSITITNNTLFTSANRPTIQRDDTDTSTLAIDASGNYWGSASPDFDSPVSGDKYLIMPHTDSNNIVVDSYGTAYTPNAGSPGATVNNLLYKVTFVDEDGMTVLYETHVASGNAPVYGGTAPTKAATAQNTFTWSGWTYGGNTYGTTDTLAPATSAQTYTATYSSAVNDYTVTVTIPANTTITVKQNGSAIQPDAGTDNQFTVPYGTELTVEYAASGAYIAGGTQSQTVTADSTKTVAAPADYTTSAAVAQIGTTYYPSLAAAVANASAGDTIELIADDTVSLTDGGEITVTKAITITGAVDANGAPLYTIYGASTAGEGYNMYNDLFIKCASGTVAVSNLCFRNFGDQVSSNSGSAPVFVSGINESVILENLDIADFNQTGIYVNGGTFMITNCVINCSKTTETVYTKGIVVVNDATGSIVDTTITDCDYTGEGDWTVAAIECIGNGNISVTGCDITSAINGIAIDTPGNYTAGSSAVMVSDCSVNADMYALFATGTGGGTLNVTSGTYIGLLSADDEGQLIISGGMFDDEVPEEYCADGYIPTGADPVTDLYSVKIGSYVAQNTTTDTKYETLAEAVADASADDTIKLLANVELDEAVDIAESITLDLDGKTVSISAANEDGFALSVSSGTVTITGNGTIDAGDDIALDVAGGTVTIANGTFGVVGVDDGSLTITDGTFDDGLLSAGGTTTINGGTFNDTVQVDGGSVTINGGTFSSDDNVLVVTDSPGSITVNGGTFTVGTSEIVACAQGGGSIEIKDGTFSGGSLYTDTDGTIAVSGGMFSVPVAEEFCATGYIPSPTTTEIDGVTYYTVKTGSYVAQIVTDGGATINKFESLAEAVAAVPTDGTATTITMIGDETIEGNAGVTIAANQNVVLDLNGHTVELAVANANAQAYLIQNNGTLTVNDSGTGGRLYANGEGKGGNNAKCAIQNCGQLTVNGGTISAKSTNASGAASGAANAVHCPAPDANVSITINGGTLTAEGGASMMNIVTSSPVYIRWNLDSKNLAFTMTGGTLTGGGSEICSAVDVYLGNKTAIPASINISGGELNGTYAALRVRGGTSDYEGVHTTISGGTFTGFNEASQTHEWALDVRAGSLEVTGGTFNYGSYLGSHEVDISGGTFAEDVILYRASGTADADISGGTFGGEIIVGGTAGNVSVDEDTNLYAEGKFISGGNFAEPVPEELCADTYIPSPQDPDTGYYTVKHGTYVAQVISTDGTTTNKFETLAAAISAAQSGETVELLTDIVNFTGTQAIDKSLVLDGAGHSITAAPVPADGHRDVVHAWAGSTNMFKILTGAVTFRNITLDGDATHAYTFLISADNSSITLTTENVRLLNGGELCGDANGEVVEAGAGYGAAVHLNNGAHMVVSNGFYACTGGKTAGCFPFTGILVDENGADVKFELTGNPNDPANIDIGGDLLLVGMPGIIDLDETQEMLDYMKVPSRFIPYTLTLGDGTAYAFTGASPLGWNDIIDYGKEIMDVSTTMGYTGLDKNSTPVEVGLLTDTVLPDTFRFADTNFTVNGNGNALSGTIEYTDNAGLIEDIILGTEDNPLVLDLTDVTQPIEIGSGISVSNVTIQMTAEQATAGTPVVIWDAAHGVDAPENEAGVSVVLVNDQGQPTSDTAELIWDDEMGMAYIGPVEARLTGPTHETPIYTTLANAIAWAEQTGDTVTLMTNIVNFTGTQTITKQDLVIDGAGYSITAAPVSTHRDVVNAWAGSTAMFKLETGDVTFRNITLDGDATHAYTFLISADNSSITLTTENVRLLNGGELCGDANGAIVEQGAGYGAAVHLNNGAHMVVSNGFYACTGGKTAGCFPFTGILVDTNGGDVKFELTGNPNDPENVDIGGDLLLVGMPGVIPLDQTQGMLDYMKVPTRFIPYTLTLGDGSAYAFTGASPLGWNDIINYGKEIMDVSTAIGYQGLDKISTPVEVGLLTDTVLPDTFRFADTNFTVNGNGNALAGTIEYTDNAGQIHDIVMGTEGNALVLDMTDTTKPIVIGSGITVSNVTVQMTAEQATAGTPVIIWDAAHGVDAPENEAGVTVQIVDDQGDSTGVTKELIWDDEMGMAYIGPCEARLTGPTHDKPIYTTLAHAIELAAQTGDTVTLLMNVTNVTTTYEISKQDLVIDGAGYTVAAAPVTEHRNMFEAWSGSKNMFKLQTGNITFRNITLDGDETHAYTFLISGDNSSVALTTENVRLIHGGEISKDSDNATVTPGNGYGAAIHLNNGAHLIVSNGFYACTGTNVNGVTTGVFPFTAILPENLEAGTSVAFELTGNPNDPANVDIGDDLLLVGMIGDLIDQYGIDTVQGILDYMMVPSRFIPYTLTLADGSAYAFTGASPRRWNEIIDYGKDIMDVATANGFSGLDKDTTPVEVGLATDTVLPAGADGDGYDFLYEDSNFSINGNGNALSGTIKFTDDANGGLMHDIDLGTDDAPLTFDLSATTNAVMLGGDVIISNVVVKLTEDQATLGKVVFEWDSGETPPDDEQGVEVTVVNNSGTPTGETKGLIWDEEYGVAYIGPCEARLTGATHETPVYTSLANALDIAKDNDKVELLTNAVLSAVQGVGSDVTLDLAGYKVSVNGAKGLLVTNATLVIADTSVKTNGTICAGDEASPASLIESGNGGVVNIPTGIFVAASGQNVLVTSDNGAIAVSGGYFSKQVLSEHCAESYMPVDAEAGAPQPYTVAEFVNEFRYPIDGSVGVPVERTWLAQNFSDIYSDSTKPVLANVTNALVEALSKNGANEMPRWESYVLGLDPTDVTARLRLTATSKDAATVTIIGLIDMTKFPKPEGTTITFRLAEVNPDGTKKKDLVTDSEEPSFDVLLEEVVGKELAIFADIAVEAVAK